MSRIALASGPPPQLPVDPPALVPLGSDYVEPAWDVILAACHLRFVDAFLALVRSIAQDATFLTLHYPGIELDSPVSIG